MKIVTAIYFSRYDWGKWTKLYFLERNFLLKSELFIFQSCFEWGLVVREEDSWVFTFQTFLFLLISDEGCFTIEHMFSDGSSFFEMIKRFLNDMCRDANVWGGGRNEGWPLSLWLPKGRHKQRWSADGTVDYKVIPALLLMRHLILCHCAILHNFHSFRKSVFC